MEKTLTVNLNSIVFHIDDDAYEMLHTYLSQIAKHFESDEEKTEIMNDIEARIAELFNEKLQKNKNVVTIEDVQEVIEIMGNPSQFSGDEDEPKAPKSETKQKKSRRFYRDPENAILGGIAGGLAAYFSWDVTLVRIILVLLVIFGAGFIIPVYIVVWLVAPEAITASQRLEMQGEDVTVESIKTELNNAKSYVESDKFKQSAGRVGSRLGEILGWVVKIILGMIGGVLGIVGVALICALLMFLFFAIFEPTFITGFVPDFFANGTIITPEKLVMLIVSMILLIGGPIFMLIYGAIRVVSGRRNHSRTTLWVVLILWLAGLFMFFSVGANTFMHLQQNNGNLFAISCSDDDDSSLDSQIRNCEPFHAIDISGNIQLTLENDSTQKVSVSTQKGFQPKVITKVEDGVLHIYTDKIFINRTIKVNVSTDSIRSIVARGACKVYATSNLVTPDLKLDLSGASELDIDVIITGFCDVNLTGASHANLSGSCNDLKVEGTGACELLAEQLISKNTDVKLSGASHADVYASERLDATATGASHINCKGTPKNVNKTSHGASEINVE